MKIAEFTKLVKEVRKEIGVKSKVKLSTADSEKNPIKKFFTNLYDSWRYTGVYDPVGDTVYISPYLIKYSDKKFMKYVLAHEFTHAKHKKGKLKKEWEKHINKLTTHKEILRSLDRALDNETILEIKKDILEYALFHSKEEEDTTRETRKKYKTSKYEKSILLKAFILHPIGIVFTLAVLLFNPLVFFLLFLTGHLTPANFFILGWIGFMGLNYMFKIMKR